MSEAEMLAEIQKLTFENRRLNGTRRTIPHGQLATNYKYTRWKTASQKTLAELVRAGRITVQQLQSFCSDIRLGKILRLAKEQV